VRVCDSATRTGCGVIMLQRNTLRDARRPVSKDCRVGPPDVAAVEQIRQR
jgi:hypothetical protein